MLTEEEKVRARHHLGYGSVQDAQTFVMGVPAGVQVQFLVEGGFARILPYAEDRFRRILASLDRVECLIEESAENVELESMGDLKVNSRAFQQIVERYRYWQGALANLMQVVPNPRDQRFFMGAGGGINVPVVG